MNIEEIKAFFENQTIAERFAFTFTVISEKEFSLIRRGESPIAINICSFGRKDKSCFAVLTTLETTCVIDKVIMISEVDEEIVIKGASAKFSISKRQE